MRLGELPRRGKSIGIFCGGLWDNSFGCPVNAQKRFSSPQRVTNLLGLSWWAGVPIWSERPNWWVENQ